jgi:co-chaperonin GroES (HSP10)
LIPTVQRESRRLDLRHSETDLLTAQLTEDPSITSTAFMVPNLGIVQTSGVRMSEVSARRESLVWFGLDKHNLTAALGDKICVRQDFMESEYSCADCRGKGHTDEICPLCEGKQQKEGVQCKNCLALGFGQEKPYPAGFVKCSACFGSGWRNGIIIPEKYQGAPVTGVVVSVGPACQWLKLGDRVLHSKFAGHTLTMKQETYTYMREHEVISLLRDM